MTNTDPEREAGIAALAECLDALPARNAKVRPTPLHPKMREKLAEQLWDRGVRLVPELATVFPIPGRQIPGVMPYMSLSQWVGADAYAKYLRDKATEPPAHGLSLEQLHAMFAIARPEAAAKLPTLTDAELAAERQAYAEKLPGAFSKLQQIADLRRRMAQAQEHKAGG